MPPKKDRTGEISYNTQGSKMIITSYRGKDDIDILFPEYNYEIKSSYYKTFKSGKIKCPYDKTVHNIGFIGEGEFTQTTHKSIYDKWYNMISRCYDPNFHISYPTYKDCLVCDEWHNFQNFANWYEENYYEIDTKIELDKDILFKGNKIYSSRTCILVPKEINILLAKATANRGEYPIGVTLFRNGKFKASITKNNKVKHLGYYDNQILAFNAYKKAKEEYIKDIAQKYCDIIPITLYDALMEYEVSIND